MNINTSRGRVGGKDRTGSMFKHPTAMYIVQCTIYIEIKNSNKVKDMNDQQVFN